MFSYEAINVPINGTKVFNWGGLERNAQPDSLLDGTVNDDSVYFAVGVQRLLGDGYPGFDNSPQTQIELHVVIPASIVIFLFLFSCIKKHACLDSFHTCNF